MKGKGPLRNFIFQEREGFLKRAKEKGLGDGSMIKYLLHKYEDLSLIHNTHIKGSHGGIYL